MTKVMINADELGGVFYDCMNHAGDHDVCTVMSTLSNVLVEACFNADCEPTIYNPGHVRIDMEQADPATVEIFKVVGKVINKFAKQYPDYVKVY